MMLIYRLSTLGPVVDDSLQKLTRAPNEDQCYDCVPQSPAQTRYGGTKLEDKFMVDNVFNSDFGWEERCVHVRRAGHGLQGPPLPSIQIDRLRSSSQLARNHQQPTRPGVVLREHFRMDSRLPALLCVL
ncbi:hypothetical protein V500_10393 [Pseudogymnoascus sp. VKM F-4518 (FW-2643)]|nr:hypothetical protein V500_10393 [Pseudogymnoascus sp. VKM F-4518 (FW-2643)]